MKSRLEIGTSKITFIFKDVYFLLTLVICFALLAFKIQDFSLAYYSDELWVYGPAVRKMGVYGPSMLPSSLALQDHWAHPLLFFFLGGIWCFLFGASIFSTHLFAATISITLLISIYFIAKSFFSKEVGFYTVLIFASQSIFHGQFALVLPEVLLTLFTLLTIYFYHKKKLGWFVLCGSCLVLTKESGVFPIVAIIIWEFIKDTFYEKDDFVFKAVLKKYFILGIPFFIICIHFILLKITYGWYLLPDRLEAFEFSWELYRERIMHTMHYVFIGQGRKPIVIILFVSAIIFNKKFLWWQKISIIAVAFSMMKVFFKYWDLPEVFSIAVIPLLFVVLIKILFFDIYKTNKRQGDMIAVFSIFIVIYLLFSSAQFDSLRYSLCLIPILIMLGIYFVQNITYFKKLVIPLFAIVSISFSFHFIYTDTVVGDDNNNYSDMCKIRRESVQFLEENNYYSHHINAPFLYRHTIKRPLTGYLKSNKIFTNVIPINAKTENCNQCICIFESKDPSVYYNSVAKNEQFKLINKAEMGSVWIEIYIKK